MQRNIRSFGLNQQSINSTGLIFIVFSLLLIIHVVLFFAGFYGGDDINFARYAAEVKNYGINTADAIDHFQLRWTPIYVTAFFYTLFGINDFSSALYSLCCMLGCGWLIFRIMKDEGWQTCLMTCILFFLGRSVIFYSHRLLADPGICLAVLTMYFAYRNLQYRSMAAGLLFALAFIGAVMTKESVIIAIPLFGMLFIYDLFRKSALKFWTSAILFSLFFLFVYLLYFRLTTGDWLFRYHLLYIRSYRNICSFDQLPAIATIRRVGYELWQAMLLNGDFLVLIPGIAASFQVRHLQKHSRLDLFSFCFLLLSVNFMSISWKSYVPLCHDPRHFLFILPFAALVGGRMLAGFSRQPNRYWILPVLYLIATIAIFTLEAGATKYLYLFCFLITWFISVLPRMRKLFVPGILLIFSANYLLDFIKPMYPYHADNRAVALEIRKYVPVNGIIYSPGFTGEMAEYYLGFPKSRYQFLIADSLRTYAQSEIHKGDANRVLQPHAKIDSFSNAYFLLDGKNDFLSKEALLALPGAKLLTSKNEAALCTGSAEFFHAIERLYQAPRLK